MQANGALFADTFRVGGAGDGPMIQVAHGAVAGTARPAGADGVIWFGTVTPTNMTASDLYVNTSTYVISTNLGAPAGGGVDPSLYSAKGALLVASAASTPTAELIGANGTVLTATTSDATTGVNWVRPVNGLGLGPTGYVAETMPRTSIDNITMAMNGTGVSLLYGIYLQEGLVVAAIYFLTGSTAAASLTHSNTALYRLSDRARLAVGTDITTTPWPVNTKRTWTMTTPYTVPAGAGGYYYVGIIVVATTMPTLTGHITASSAANNLPPIVAGSSSTLATGAMPDPAAALSATTNMAYAWIT